jgi:hypothetical protein
MICIGCDAINMLTTCAAHGGPQWLTGLYMPHKVVCDNLSVYKNMCLYIIIITTITTIIIITIIIIMIIIIIIIMIA